MKYAILNQRQNVLAVFDEPPEQSHVEVSDELVEKINSFKEQNRLAFLINGEITNFREQKSLGNFLRWDTVNGEWTITPMSNLPTAPQPTNSDPI
jgi:hypothetical protein